jgi:SPP1 family predicted phage head-tail adaptor
LKPLKAGELRKRGQIQQLPDPTGSQANRNAANEPDLTGNWKKFADVWFKIEDLSGREQRYADQIAAGATHLITTRYFPGVLPTMRIAFVEPQTKRKRVFNFTFVADPEERHYKLEITGIEDPKAPGY